MKICYIVNSFPPSTEFFIAHEIQGLMDMGLEVTVISVFQPRSNAIRSQFSFFDRITYLTDRRERPRGGSVKFGSMPKELRSTWRMLKSQRFASRAASCVERCEHVHAHFATLPSSVGLFLASRWSARYSLSVHARDIFVEPWSIRRKVKRANFVWACSGFGAEALCTLIPKGERHKVHVMYHGIDVAEWECVRTRRRALKGRRERRWRIVSVGRLVPKKGFRRLVEAVTILRDSGKPVELIIAGDGPDRPLLERMVSQSGLRGSVVLKGHCQVEVLKDLYTEGDLFVLPCCKQPDGDMDNIPNVLLEAMACEIPIVTTSLGGIPELLDKDSAVLLQDNVSASVMAAEICKVMKNPEARLRMTRAAMKVLQEKFDRRTTTSRMYAAFTS